MGTIPVAENIRRQCPDGGYIEVAADTTTSELACD
jgi:hypothetical protein